MGKKKVPGSKGGAKQEAKELKKKKQEEKASKAAKKRSGKDAQEAGEDDIEAILAEIFAKEEQKAAVTISMCEGPPSPRANFTVTSMPTGDIILFGGEYFDGQDTTCFNELFRWNVEKNEWRQIESPNTPPPRCSHQAAFFRDHLYVLGGEFATTEQFYHYRDFWRLNVKTNAWEKLEMSGKAPSARSGHRMVVWRNQLVLFGGFYETFRETKRFNDLYIMSFQDLKQVVGPYVLWRRIEFPGTAPIPSPRSGHQMAVHAAGEQIFLYGGYSKEKEPGQKKEGKVHNDMWVLNMKPAVSGGSPTWDRIGKKGSPPSIRSSAAMTVHKNRALLFGGVLDHEGPQHAVKSVFYNDLFAFDMERRRWYHLALKKASKKKAKDKGRGKQAGGGGSGGGSAQEAGEQEEDEEEDYIDSEDEKQEGEKAPHENAFVFIDNFGKLVYVDPEEGERDEAHLEEKQEEVGPRLVLLHYRAKSCVAAGAVIPQPKDDDAAKKGEEQEERGDTNATSPVGASDVPAKSQNPAVVAVETPEVKGTKDEGEEESPLPPCPLPRINPCLTVRGNTLYVYGGILEVGDREYTLDDCWALDLNTRLAWKCLQKGTMDEQMWKAEEEDSEMGSEWGEEEEEDGSDEEGSDQEEDDAGRISAGMSCLDIAVDKGEEEGPRSNPDKGEGAARDRGGSQGKRVKKSRGGVREEIRQLQELLGVDDPNRTPQARGFMRDFFDRTKRFWIGEVIRRGEESGVPMEPMSEKELRKEAFLIAGERYSELEPSLARLNKLEAEQRELEQKEADKRKERKASSHRAGRL
ncbi:unnamed protein product [Ascophyllum nodosum]